MAHHRYIDGQKVVHTRSLPNDEIEVTFQNAVPGERRVKRVMSMTHFHEQVQQIPLKSETSGSRPIAC